MMSYPGLNCAIPPRSYKNGFKKRDLMGQRLP
jgi:hypothetical protein